MNFIKKLFRNHSDAVLISLTVVFLGVIGGFLYETIGVTISELGGAIETPRPTISTGFDMIGAAKINFKGLSGNASSSGIPIPVPAPVRVFVPPPPVQPPIPTTTPTTTPTPATSTTSSSSTFFGTASGTVAQ